MPNPLGPSIFITGANRGLGLAFVKELVKQEQVTLIFAACRNPDQADALNALAKKHPAIQVLKMDVSNDSEIAGAVKLVKDKLGDRGLYVLFNNAAILTETGAEYIKPDRKILEQHMSINLVSPIMVTDAFLSLLRKESSADKPSLVVNISSDNGSIQDAMTMGTAWGNIAYGITKAGLNMYTRYLGSGEKYNNIVAVSVHPGWLRTDMGTPDAPDSVEHGAEAVIETLSKLSIKDNGRYINNRGRDMRF
uniref:NAD(P)-binding protein n=1 Tax=Panagrellus redivivus TaxID=6233 RepID=A0A7E4VKC3_PANRE